MGERDARVQRAGMTQSDSSERSIAARYIRQARAVQPHDGLTTVGRVHDVYGRISIYSCFDVTALSVVSRTCATAAAYSPSPSNACRVSPQIMICRSQLAWRATDARPEVFGPLREHGVSTMSTATSDALRTHPDAWTRRAHAR